MSEGTKRKLELNTLDELDQLLAESVASYEQKKTSSSKKKRIFSDADLDDYYLYAPLDAAPSYITQFSCAVFFLLTCSHCGAEFMQFSHFTEFQVWSRESSSKPSCWRRVVERPAKLAAPRFLEKTVPGCECCCSSEQALLLKRPERGVETVETVEEPK